MVDLDQDLDDDAPYVENLSLDLGGGVTLRWTCWRPDRALNAQYADIPDVDRYGAIIEFPDGCTGHVTFDGDVARVHGASAEAAGGHQAPLWTVETWEPLTISPSVLQNGGSTNAERQGEHPAHEHHGWIREGRWVPA